MTGLESLRIAIQGLMVNRLRSALTMLGVIIGVAAVIILVSVGTGSSAAVQKRIQGLGTNVLLIMRTPNRGGNGAGQLGTQSRSTDLTLQDARALQDQTNAPDVKYSVPVVTVRNATAVYQGNSASIGEMTGSTPQISEASNYPVSEGSFFSQEDYASHNKVVVIGPTVVANVFGGSDPVGRSMLINGASFQVVGVTVSKGSNGFQDRDDVAIAPLTSVQDSLTGVGPLSEITIEARSARTINAASEEVSAILATRKQVANPAQLPFRILNQASLLATSTSTSQTFTVLLGAVAAVSLLVGGIGVMNIMLVTVTERTREIGIRKAIGAPKGAILGQFLIEAVLLSVVGGLLGVAAGIIGSRFKIAGVQPVVEPYSVFLAFGVSVAVGLFFGIYPANRAASLRPIEALRFE
ncbi:MAG: ABC transporter permease [Acidimicrobiales bacterium]